MNLKFFRNALLILFLLTINFSYAQNNQSPLTKGEKKEAVESVGRLLIENYIFPDAGQKAANYLSQNFEKGIYDAINDPVEFADKLTADVVSITGDKHFCVFFDPQRVADERKSVNQTAAAVSEAEIADWRKNNFGFKEVKILDGNIGYINLTGFYDLKYGAETAAAAMNFLSGADALIIDLRYNHGGDSAMAQFLSSYFFDSEPVLLYDFYAREKNETKMTQYSTLPYLPGKRIPRKDLYFLTSNFTFSAPEGLAYSLQNLKRAVIVGETTGGGANMWKGMIATDRFYVHMPFTRPVDPITKTNWEGIGVKPDVTVPAKDALLAAHVKALENLAAAQSDNSRYLWFLTAVKARLKPVSVSQSTLKSFEGIYGDKKISFENGKLFFQSRGTKAELQALETDLFGMEEFNFFRIKFITENGKTTALMMLNDDGTSRKYPKER